MPTQSHDGEGGGRFHPLAQSPIRYGTADAPPAELRLCFSGSSGFTRLSFHVVDAKDEAQIYQRGPEHSMCVDAALLAAWADVGVPAFAWRLAPQPSASAFESPMQATEYGRARLELCRALYPIRMRVWTNAQLNAERIVHPPGDGFACIDAFAVTAENEELLLAVTDDDAVPPGNG